MSRLVVFLFSTVLLAQAPPGMAPPSGGANLPAQKIGANDLIAVSVYDAPELTRTVRVGADGLIRMPMIERSIRAEGLLPSELETGIVEALRREQILVAPVVTITIVEYHSRPVSVAGAVQKPLTFQAYTTVTLLDALTRAGGLRQDAGPEILVSRSQPGPDGGPISLVQRIPVKELLDSADPEWNVNLYGGEEIRVPEVGRVFVVGNVTKPGAYPVEDASGTSVLKVLALTEGLAPFARKEGYIYRREATTGGKNEIAIPLRKIMERKSPDVLLQANDILYIPDNRGKRVRMTALEKIIGFGSATASGVLVWGVAR